MSLHPNFVNEATYSGPPYLGINLGGGVTRGEPLIFSLLLWPSTLFKGVAHGEPLTLGLILWPSILGRGVAQSEPLSLGLLLWPSF